MCAKRKTDNVLEEVKQEHLENALVETSDPFYHLIADKKPSVKQAIQLWLTGRYKIVEIADMTGWHYETVRGWLLRDDDVIQYINHYQQEEMQLIKNKLQAATANALDRMIELCDSKVDAIAIQAARDILDRNGLKPIQRVQKDINVNSYEEKIKSLIDDVEIIETDYEVLDE